MTPYPTRERPRLLVVDDQPENIRIMHGIFGADYEVFMATTGSEAIDISLHRHPDLLLLDIRMPGIDGLDVCRRLKSHTDTADIPIIFVTGCSEPQDETAGLEAGAVDFITKPVNPAVVRARVRTHLTLRSQAEALKRMAYEDGLTGVINRRGFEEALDREWRVGLRNQSPVGLIMIDVDHFKSYNDRYGHLEGDRALRWVADRLARALRRPNDVVARYGGEEFVALLPGVGLEQTLRAAEHLRSEIESGARPHASAGNEAGVVTISLGATAEIPMQLGGETHLVRQADTLLYAAKRQGRNRVCHVVPRPAPAS